MTTHKVDSAKLKLLVYINMGEGKNSLLSA